MIMLSIWAFKCVTHCDGTDVIVAAIVMTSCIDKNTGILLVDAPTMDCKGSTINNVLCGYITQLPTVIWYTHDLSRVLVAHVCVNGLGRHHDDVIKWKHFPRNWPFVREIHRSPVNFPYKGQWRGALMFSLTYAWINDWVNNREAGDLRRQRGHYDVIVMIASGNGLSPVLHQTINRIIVELFYYKVQLFSFKEKHLNISSAKRRPLCLCQALLASRCCTPWEQRTRYPLHFLL